MNKKEKIDQVIRGKSISAEDAAAAAIQLRRALKIVYIILPRIKETRFRQLADFYTLVLLIHSNRSEGMAVGAHNSVRNRIAGPS